MRAFYIRQPNHPSGPGSSVNNETPHVVSYLLFNLERFKKYCGHPVKWKIQAGPFGFWRRFGAVTSRCRHAPLPKSPQRVKIPGSERPHYFLRRSDPNRFFGGEKM